MAWDQKKVEQVQHDPDIAHLTKVFRMGGDVAFGLAQLYRERGNYEAAIWYYSEELKRRPYSPYSIVARIELGDLLFTVGRDEEAESQYRQVLKYNIAEKARIMHNLGIILWRKGEVKECCRLLEGALKRDPHLYSSYFALMEIYEQEGNIRKLAKTRERFATVAQMLPSTEGEEFAAIKKKLERLWNRGR